MTFSWLEAPARGLGRTLTSVAAAAVVVGLAALIAGVALDHARVVFAALTASWLFFAGLAAGGVALAAAVRIASGRWAVPILPIADAGVRFFAPAVVVLLVVIGGVRTLLPAAVVGGGGWSLGWTAVRLILAAALVFLVGARFVRRARAEPGAEGRVQSAAVGYVLAYAVGLSVWAFDLVMRVNAGPLYTVIPPYYFLGAFVSGVAWVALVAALRDVSGPDLRYDVGKLLFAFIIVWSYLLWALFLPTWYGNVPEEVAPLLGRARGGWGPVTLAVLIAVFAWPFWLLFPERFKRHRTTLGVGAAAVVLGLWAERFLLVLPPLRLTADVGSWIAGACVSAGVAGLFLLSVGPGLGAPAPGPAAARRP